MADWRSFKQNRRLQAALVLLLAGIIAGLIVDGVRSSDPVYRARHYFRESFVAGTYTERMSDQLDRIEPRVAVAALCDLLEEQTSRLAQWYEAIHPKIPSAIQQRLPKPVDRQRVLSRTLELLKRYGTNAAPATKELAAICLSKDPKQTALFSAAASALARIGPPAVEAIPSLLPGLRSGSTVDALAAIDPTGDLIDIELRKFLGRDGQSAFASEISLKACQLMKASTNTASTSPQTQWVNPWFSIQILGLLRVEATNSVPAIRPFLKDPRERVRGAAVTALGRLGPAARDALPDIRACFTDDWGMVRDAATNAILNIERPEASIRR